MQKTCAFEIEHQFIKLIRAPNICQQYSPQIQLARFAA